MGKISNITNCNDPQSICSRVFVGNLNTFTLTKEDVECLFARYGRIIGISMHKGYAFVQYTSEYEARNSVAGEDQRIYAGQPIDVNMAAEPKPNRPSRKRPQEAGQEWDFYYHTPVRMPIPPPLKRARPDFGAVMAMKVPHLKRGLLPVTVNHMAAGAAAIVPPRLMPKTARQKGKGGMPAKHQPGVTNSTPSAESADILICGNCKQVFTDIEKLTSHKLMRCKLRFSCSCDDTASHKPGEPTSFTCATCHTQFSSCWLLCQHVQADHNLSVYEESKTNNINDTNASAGINGDNSEHETGSDGMAQEAEGELADGVPDGSEGAAIYSVEEDNGTETNYENHNASLSSNSNNNSNNLAMSDDEHCLRRA